MHVYTLDQLIAIERIATRAVNSAKAFAEGTDRALLEDLLTLMSEVRHAASCTQVAEVVIADLWVHQEARTDALRVERERKTKEAAEAAFESWGRGGAESTEAAKRWAEYYAVDRWAVQDLLSDMIEAEFKRKGL